MDPPGFAREILRDDPKEFDCVHISGLFCWSILWLLALMESAALAPQHFMDLQWVYAISRFAQQTTNLIHQRGAHLDLALPDAMQRLHILLDNRFGCNSHIDDGVSI
jgi:hypothetical protein